MTNETKRTPGPYSANYNAVGKAWRLIGADGYGAIAEVYREANAAMLAQGLNERDALRVENARLIELAKHIAAMETDAYLSGHPEWHEICAEARAALKGGQS